MITRCCDLRQPMSCLCCYILREAPIMHIASFSGPTGSNKAFVSFIHIVQCISQNYYVYHNTYANYILKETRWNSKNGFLCSFTTKDMKCTWQIQWKLKNQIGCNEKSFFRIFIFSTSWSFRNTDASISLNPVPSTLLALGSDVGAANAGDPTNSSMGATINGTGKTLYTEWFFSAVCC